jgi:predicted lipoprotein with Yx(FWY)xxD motif
LLAVLAAAAAALALAAPSPGERSSTVGAHTSDYGTILFDGRGFVLYVFTRDARGHSTCAGACAKAWPPFVARGRLTAAKGATAKLLGSIRRGDGTRQITYAGRPLYLLRRRPLARPDSLPGRHRVRRALAHRPSERQAGPLIAMRRRSGAGSASTG